MPSYLEMSLRIDRRQASVVESLLEGQGALAVTLTDHGDTPLWEPAPHETPLWNRVRVTGLFASDVDHEQLRAAMALLSPEHEPEFRTVEDQVWERAWMERFEPMKFGRGLWIIPGGMEPPDPEATLLRLDPGLAFGTGTHATTRLCLEWLDQAMPEHCAVLDFGCGSGVLGVAAALLGAASVICLDYDPQAVLATEQNALVNSVSHQVTARQADTPAGCEADLVVANILAPILIRLAPELARALRPGGTLLLAGVLEEQAVQVIDAFDGVGIDVTVIRQAEEWVLLKGHSREQ